MAKVDDFLYVREKADSDSEIVGKMYKGDRAVVKEAGDTWTKIESGNVTGYVKNEYCVTGTDALNYAKKHCDTVAKVSIDGLRIRKAPDTDAEVVKTVASGEHMDVNTKAEETDGWIAVKVGSDTCYVSDDYVTVTLDTGKAVTIEEEQAAIKVAEEKKAAEEAKKNASVSSEKKSSSGQSASSQTTQNASIAASADEETLLAALVQCEAGGTSVQCMTAVGAVVVNRVRSGGFDKLREMMEQQTVVTVRIKESNLLLYFFKYDVSGESWYNSYTLFSTFGGAVQILSMMVLFPLLRKFMSSIRVFYLRSDIL